MTDDLPQHPEISVDKAKENEAKEKEEALQKLIKSIEAERIEALEDLLAKQKLTQSTNKNNKAALEKAIEELSKRNLESPEQKMSLVEWFCRKSPQFNDMVNLLEKTADSLQLPELVASIVKNLDKHFSSPEKNLYKKINIRGSNPNEIKLNKQENLIDQLNEKGVDLDLFDEKISKLARPLNRNVPHYVQITLPDNRFLTLDIFQYERDKAQSYGPPSGPKESNQEQPALGWSPKGILKNPAESSSAELNSNNKKNTSTTIPNYLPTPLPKKGVKFAENVKENDGTIGTNGYWVRATTQNSNETNSGKGNR